MGKGGSCAYYAPGLGWSNPYLETTGYLIPTLLKLDQRIPGKDLCTTAANLGEWLLSLEDETGGWQGGLYSGRKRDKASIFNTGQIILGLVALFNSTNDSRWLEAAKRGAMWLSDGVGADGQWAQMDYRSENTPTYYTHVAWPMLEVWKVTGDQSVMDSAVRVLESCLSRRSDDGSFRGWGFEENKPAFTRES